MNGTNYEVPHYTGLLSSIPGRSSFFSAATSIPALGPT